MNPLLNPAGGFPVASCWPVATRLIDGLVEPLAGVEPVKGEQRVPAALDRRQSGWHLSHRAAVRHFGRGQLQFRPGRDWDAGCQPPSLTVTDGGCGYSTNPPAVQLENAGGTGATASAVVSNGVVVSIQVTSAGIGYTNAPDVVIDPPPTPPLALVKAVRPLFTDLVWGQPYQLQVSSDMAAWVNQGSQFTPTWPTMPYPQYFDVSQANPLFFRLKPAQ